MDKVKLERFISKYFLNGACDSVVWKSEFNETGAHTMSVTCSSPNRNLIMRIKFATQNELLLDPGEYGISDTKKLKNMLSVLNGVATASVINTNKMNTGISFTDGSTSVLYALADPTVIPPPPGIKDIPIGVTLEFDEQSIFTYIRSRAALPDVTGITIKSDGVSPVATIMFGDTSINSDRISLKVKMDNPTKIPGITLSCDYLKEIFMVNKEVKSVNLGISKTNDVGVVHIEVDDFICDYYLPKLTII